MVFSKIFNIKFFYNISTPAFGWLKFSSEEMPKRKSSAFENINSPESYNLRAGYMKNDNTRRNPAP